MGGEDVIEGGESEKGVARTFRNNRNNEEEFGIAETVETVR